MARRSHRPRLWPAGFCPCPAVPPARCHEVSDRPVGYSAPVLPENASPLPSSCLASSTPAASSKADRDIVINVDLGLVFAEGHEAGLLLEPAHHEEPETKEDRNGNQPGKDRTEKVVFESAGILDVVFIQKFGNVGIDPHSAEPFVGFTPLFGNLHAPTNLVLGDGDFCNLPLFHRFCEFTVRNVFDGQRRSDHVVQKQHQPGRILNRYTPNLPAGEIAYAVKSPESKRLPQRCKRRRESEPRGKS
jgi:hypothetical protein